VVSREMNEAWVVLHWSLYKHGTNRRKVRHAEVVVTWLSNTGNVKPSSVHTWVARLSVANSDEAIDDAIVPPLEISSFF